MRALVVEDDFVTGMVMQEILSLYGEVEIAVNGVEGLDKYKESMEGGTKYDIIFMDIMMPGMTGQEAVQEIRAYETKQGIHASSRTTIIMNTALDDFENIKKAFKNQVDGYFVKPFDKEKLVNILQEKNLI